MADYPTFVAVFPEFANAPYTAVTYWLSQAPLQLNQRRFGSNFDLASMLFVAHNLALGWQEKRTMEKGGIPGDALGPVSSKSVGGVSISYDAAGIAIPGAGAWNATSYGQRLYKMMQAAACGGVLRAARQNLGPFVGHP